MALVPTRRIVQPTERSDRGDLRPEGGDEVLEERRKQAARFSPTGRERRQDPRWAIAKRPVVSAGGELSLKDLEMRYSSTSNFYIAPLQWKANSGGLILDDFGRQMIQPQELLNRWIVPMEQGIDHLSLHTGDTVELPFDMLLIFSSNIPPGRLGDEAFFRRIQNKILEAMAMGRPVVASRECVETLTVDRGIELIDAADAEGFVHQIGTLLRAPGRAARHP